MIGLLIVLGVLLFLLLLLLCPLRIEVSFQEQFSLTLRYLFLKFRILPGKEKEPEPEEPPEEESEEKTGLQTIKRLLKQEGFTGFLKALFELVKIIASSTKKIIWGTRLKSFDLYLCLGGAGDAAEAAVQYGKLSGAVYAACGFLFGLTGCKKKSVTVDLDYQAEENKVVFFGKISILPLLLLKEAVVLLVKSLPFIKKFMGAGKSPSKKKGDVQ